MDLSWIPEGLKQVRLLWESIYDKSPTLAYFVVISIFPFPFYCLHTWTKFSGRERDLDDKVASAWKKYKERERMRRE
ncbi:hypothetical protein EJM35_11320 [Salmonella enterica]|nr:hypothetical protein [Salmonella enterica]